MARILVIDDDSGVRKLLKNILEASAHEVIEASDGENGIRLFVNNPADLVITDILMPTREGIQTIIDLKRDYPRVKILAISGGGTIGPHTYLGMARDFGADRTLSKPFSLDEVNLAVNELLGKYGI